MGPTFDRADFHRRKRGYRAAARAGIAEPCTPEPSRLRQLARFVARAIGFKGAYNEYGNYRGKRTPRPLPPLHTPKERFASLAAHYLSHQMTYQNPRSLRELDKDQRAFRRWLQEEVDRSVRFDPQLHR